MASSSEDELRAFICGALEQNRRWLTAYCLAVTGDADAAQDIVQEVFLRALRSAERYDPAAGTLGAWLRGIARHVLREHGRKVGRDPLGMTDAMLAHLDDRAARAEQNDADPDYHARRLHLLRQCLDTLTAHVRRIVHMKYQQRTRSAGIAAALNMSESAVNVALCRGRRLLQQCIEQKVRESDG